MSEVRERQREHFRQSVEKKLSVDKTCEMKGGGFLHPYRSCCRPLTKLKRWHDENSLVLFSPTLPFTRSLALFLSLDSFSSFPPFALSWILSSSPLLLNKDTQRRRKKEEGWEGRERKDSKFKSKSTSTSTRIWRHEILNNDDDDDNNNNYIISLIKTLITRIIIHLLNY